MLLIFLSCLTQRSIAQSDALFIENFDANSISFSEEDLFTIQKFETSPFKKTTKIIKVSDVKMQQHNGFLSFKIPNTEEVLKAEVIEIDEESPTEYTWMGRIIDENNDGNICIVNTPEGKAGFIQTKDSYYTIHPINKDYSLFFEHDRASYGDSKCLVDDETPEEGFPTDKLKTECVSDGDCPAVIDILVLAPPTAVAILAPIASNLPPTNLLVIAAQKKKLKLMMKMAEAEVNTAFKNSGVLNKRVNFIFHNSFIPSITLQGKRIDIDGNNLLKNENQIWQLRDFYKADMVFVFLGDYPTGQQGFSYRPENGGSTGDKRLAVVGSSFIQSPNHIPAHEIGHLFDCYHGDTGAESGALCNKGFELLTNKKTIVNELTSIPTILHYSSSDPNITFAGSPTGDLEHNNAGAIRQNGCKVSETNNGAIQVSIVDHTATNEDELYKLCKPGAGKLTQTLILGKTINPSNSSYPVKPPYQYEWYYSLDGFYPPNPSLFLISKGNTLLILNTDDHKYQCPFYYILLKVIGSDGQSVTVKKKISIESCCNPTLVSNKASNPYQYTTFNSYGIKAFPNPANDFVTIDFKNSVVGEIIFRVIDVNGRTVKESKWTEAIPKNQFNVDTSEFSSGHYTFQYLISREVLNIALSIQKNY